MKPNVIKYVGRFSGAEASGLVFPKGVPVLVHQKDLYEALVSQPDYVASSLAELDAAANPTPATKTPGTTVLVGTSAPVAPAAVETILVSPTPSS